MLTLLFLHGWATDASVWQRQRDYFGKQYKIIAPDLHCDNLLALDKKIYDLAKDEDALVIIGWSFGWLLVLKLLEHRDLKIKGLVSVCGTPKLIASDYTKDGVKISDLVALRRSLKENFIDTLGNFFRTHKVTYNPQDALPRKDACIKQLDILGKEDFRDNLKLIKAPTLFISGGKDMLCPLYIAQYMQARVTGSIHKMMEGTSHAPFMENCDGFNAILSDFLKKL